MNWSNVFIDIQQWMADSNHISEKYPITSDKYWDWLIQSIGELGNRYNNHPVVLAFLTVLIKIQEDSYKQVVGGNANG